MSVTHFKPQRNDLKIVLIKYSNAIKIFVYEDNITIYNYNHCHNDYNICDNGYIYNKQNFGLYWVK